MTSRISAPAAITKFHPVKVAGWLEEMAVILARSVPEAGAEPEPEPERAGDAERAGTERAWAIANLFAAPAGAPKS